MTSPPLAARVLAVLERDTGRTDDELAAELGVTIAELSPVIGRLYRQGRAGRCAGYLVAFPPALPARRPIASQEDFAVTTLPTSPGNSDHPGALTTAALCCAVLGWHVFPLRPGTKRPALHGEDDCPHSGPCAGGHLKWEQRASTDPGIIRRCWDRAAYNIGVATGPSGLVVIDLDKPKPGQAPPPAWAQPGITDGADTLAALCDRHGQPYPAGTFTVRTRRGGLHLYFTAPPGTSLRNTTGDSPGGLGWLIDTRGHGGYVVAPGSVVHLPDGAGRYEVTNDQAPALLPGWLARLLTPASPAPPNLAGRSPLPDRVRDLDSYAATALKGETERVRTAAVHGRNRALNKAAYQLGRLIAAGALPEDLAREELYAAASAHFATDPPVTPAEARATITAGLAAGRKHPRQLADREAAA
jgi:hypothetical protein